MTAKLPRRSGPMGQLRCMQMLSLIAISVVASGCASLTSKWDVLPERASNPEPQASALLDHRALADPSDQAFEIALETAKLAEQRGMDAEAITAYQKVRHLNPDHPGVSHALAVLYDRSAMTDAAEREYNASLGESPKDVNVLCDYGYFLYSTGKLDDSERILRSGLSINQKHRQTTINLAVVLATKRRYDEAQRLFENAIGPAAALHNIGIFKLRHGNAAEGETMIAAALEKDPSLRESKAVLENVDNSANRSYLVSRVEGLLE